MHILLNFFLKGLQMKVILIPTTLLITAHLTTTTHSSEEIWDDQLSPSQNFTFFNYHSNEKIWGGALAPLHNCTYLPNSKTSSLVNLTRLDLACNKDKINTTKSVFVPEAQDRNSFRNKEEILSNHSKPSEEMIMESKVIAVVSDNKGPENAEVNESLAPQSSDAIIKKGVELIRDYWKAMTSMNENVDEEGAKHYLKAFMKNLTDDQLNEIWEYAGLV